MHLTPPAYTLLGLTALIAGLVAVLAFALLRFSAAAARCAAPARGGGGETALLSAALQEAVTKLKAQERATAARADASERLSSEIISSLTAGLLVAGLHGEVRILNPAGLRVLDRARVAARPTPFQRSPREQPLMDVIDECLRDRSSIVRREVVAAGDGHGVTHLGVSVSPLFDPKGEPHGAICLFTDLTAREGSRGAAAAEGEPGDGRRADRRHRARIPQRAGDDSRLQQARRPERAARTVPSVRRRHPRRDRIAVAGGHELPELRAPGAAHADRGRSRRDLRTGGGGNSSRCPRARRRRRGARRVRRGRRRRGAPATGVQQSVAQRRGRLRGGAAAAHRRSSREVDFASRVLRITVADNGPGIAAALREKMFQPFFTTKRDGTGLGLALVQKIIVFHNGRIAVATTPIGGASFQITLPLA